MTAPRPPGSVAPPAWRLEHALTDDGWDLAIYRYPNDEAKTSVVICGGYACNRHFVDFDDRYSIARFLARRGVDAWVLEPRGRGASVPGHARVPRTWTFDDIARFDVPAAVAHVAAATGRRPVWIGHSMGGMAAYAALGMDPDLRRSVRGLVTLASPLHTVAHGSRAAQTLGNRLIASTRRPRVPQRTLLVAAWWAIGASSRFVRLGMDPENVDREAFGRALRRFICDVPWSKFRQLVRWSTTGAFDAEDGSADYRANLTSIDVPVLVICGAGDRIAPPADVRAAFEALGSSDKRYREFSVAAGDAADYGHVDLVFGRRAPEEVFGSIAAWIAEREEA